MSVGSAWIQAALIILLEDCLIWSVFLKKCQFDYAAWAAHHSLIVIHSCHRYHTLNSTSNMSSQVGKHAAERWLLNLRSTVFWSFIITISSFPARINLPGFPGSPTLCVMYPTLISCFHNSGSLIMLHVIQKSPLKFVSFADLIIQRTIIPFLRWCFRALTSIKRYNTDLHLTAKW